MEGPSHFVKVWEVSKYKFAFIRYTLKKYYVKDFKATHEVINQIVLGGVLLAKTDLDIIHDIYSLVKNLPDSKTRTNDRLKNREQWLYKMVGSKKITSYLDYGCGDGSITRRTGEALGAKDIYGVDLHDNHIEGITYLQKTTAPIPDAHIDLVTLFVTLHHLSADDLDHCITEISRVLSPDGVLLIREHDFDYSDEMRSFLDLVHIFIDVVGADTLPPCPPNTYPINYQSNKYWTNLLYKRGFYLEKMSAYYGNNPHGLYYASYKRKK